MKARERLLDALSFTECANQGATPDQLIDAAIAEELQQPHNHEALMRILRRASRIQGAPLICSDERHAAKVAALEAQLAALRHGEEPHEDDRVVPTPAQWIWRWNRAAPEQRLQVAEKAIADADHFYQCFMSAWPDRARDAEDRLAAARARIAELERHAGRVTDHTFEGEPIPGYLCGADLFGQRCGAAWERHDLREDCQHQNPKQLGHRPGSLALVCACGAEVFPGPRPTACPPSCADGHGYEGGCLLDPLADLSDTAGISGANRLDGWAWRCWGTDDCDGWLSHGHTSAAAARRAYDRHVQREHGVELASGGTVTGLRLVGEEGCTHVIPNRVGTRRKVDIVNLAQPNGNSQPAALTETAHKLGAKPRTEEG
jgi:hypothetical protein